MRVTSNDFAAVTIAGPYCFGQGEWGKLNGFDRSGACLYVDRPREHGLAVCSEIGTAVGWIRSAIFDSALKADPIKASN